MATPKGESMMRFVDMLARHRTELAAMEQDLERSWGVGGGQDARALYDATTAVLHTVRDGILAEARKRGIR
jgi:hypothetical protein